MSGPLSGITLVEFAGIGPGPFCGMVLADLGANIIRIDRDSQHGHGNTQDFQHRSKSSLSADLKNPQTIKEIKKLLTQVDGLIEGFRPGVMERLGLGPDECLACNPNLVYGRMTGWGQDGPLAHTAGHDINYIALTGALQAMGRTLPWDSTRVGVKTITRTYWPLSIMSSLWDMVIRIDWGLAAIPTEAF